MAKKKQSTKTKKSSARSKRPPRPFPRETLETALKVPQAIKEKNGGNPWATSDVASAVGHGPRTTPFYYLTAASRDFGLTEGTRETAEISLTEKGRQVVYASSPDEELQAKREAFLSIEIFQKVLKHYQGSDLPEMKYLGNTLEREFDLHPDYHEEFSRVFRENTQYLGITTGEAPTDQSSEDGDKDEAPASKTTVTMGEPKSKSKLKSFVIMPFTEKGGSRPEKPSENPFCGRI